MLLVTVPLLSVVKFLTSAACLCFSSSCFSRVISLCMNHKHNSVKSTDFGSFSRVFPMHCAVLGYLYTLQIPGRVFRPSCLLLAQRLVDLLLQCRQTGRGDVILWEEREGKLERKVKRQGGIVQICGVRVCVEAGTACESLWFVAQRTLAPVRKPHRKQKNS